VVDDEPDILETISELLAESHVDTALTFDEAVALFKNNTYDVAILDIMGVNGYDLLKITHRLGTLSMMLTAHALTPEHLKKSIEQEADAYVPKDMLANVPLYVADLLHAKKRQ
jgi:DNA-binding response OmpR family regulator